MTGSNDELIERVCAFYLADGMTVADVTYGRGVFWKRTDTARFTFLPSDLATGVDFRSLPYKDASIDALVLDPPYMHGGATIKQSINACYKNANTSHESVVRLYAGGVLEAARVLVKHGVLLVKCQDEIESGKQRWTHVEIIDMLKMLGFTVVDMFVLVQDTIPAMRESYQKTARKNHSYLIVARFSR